MAMLRTIGVVALACLARAGTALAQGATRTWDFQTTAVGSPPAGFSIATPTALQ